MITNLCVWWIMCINKRTMVFPLTNIYFIMWWKNYVVWGWGLKSYTKRAIEALNNCVIDKKGWACVIENSSLKLIESECEREKSRLWKVTRPDLSQKSKERSKKMMMMTLLYNNTICKSYHRGIIYINV